MCHKTKSNQTKLITYVLMGIHIETHTFTKTYILIHLLIYISSYIYKYTFLLIHVQAYRKLSQIDSQAHFFFYRQIKYSYA